MGEDILVARKAGKKIMELLRAGEEVILNGTRKVMDEAEESAFMDGIEIGIVNTIASLYEANTKDEEIIRVLTKCWGMNREEAEDRLIYEKGQAPVRVLKEYMKLKGYSDSEIDDFIRIHQVSIKVRNDRELWELRRNPEKLMKIVQ